MKILALETDIEKLNKGFLSAAEEQIIMVRFHGIRFVFALCKTLAFTAIIVALAIGGWYATVPTEWLWAIGVVAWVVAAGVPLLRSFIDWKFDELVLTTDKIVIVDQSSLIRQVIREMNLENIASVETRTQFWGILPIGKLNFNLKEGTGEEVTLPYIPQAQRVCSIISDALVKFQRRGTTKAL
jgi:hypothetical protein